MMSAVTGTSLCPNCFSARHFVGNQCPVCGYRNLVKRDERALPLGTILHRQYLVGRVLGIGGFGITYICWDAKSRERVAIKEYFPAEWAKRPQNDKRIVPGSQDKERLYHHGQEVFVNEARVLYRLRGGPHIVGVKAFFQENATAYMVMDLIIGSSLSAYLRRYFPGGMSLHSAGEVIQKVGMALHYVHRNALLHRDVGPDNIMLTEDGDIKLIDFGATRIYALNSPKSMSVLVKPGFAPIEQYSRTGHQGPWTDVYALAATYYYLMTGKKPPEAPDRIAGVRVTELSEIRTDTPPHISRAVRRAMSENWRNRQQTVYEFLREMQLLPEEQKQVRREENEIGKTQSLWEIDRGAEKKKRPCVLMQTGNWRTRYYFMEDNTLRVGRLSEKSNLLLPDTQVSGLHFRLTWKERENRFYIENFSANRTYTVRGTLNKNQSTWLREGDWIYIQTIRERYIFYLEVE